LLAAALAGLVGALGTVGAVGAATAVSGCSRDRSADRGTRTEDPQMTADERQRGQLACGHYVERLCRCAHDHAEHVDACRLAQAQPDALELSLDLLGDRSLHPDDRAHALANARKVIAACLDADARLDLVTCPRQAPAIARPPLATPPAGGAPPVGDPVEPGTPPVVETAE
jgi:hypothetical protein